MGSKKEHDPTVALKTALSRLKNRGSNLLVTGIVAADIHRRACHRFLGDETFAPRQRLVVLTSADPHTGVKQYLTTTGSTASIRVISYAPGRRTAAAGDSLNEELTTATRVKPGDLPKLKIAVAEAIADIQDQNKDLPPAGLRVCVDSLLPIIDDHGREAVVRLVYPVAQRIRAAQGMGHFHLPVDPELTIVEELAPMFEGVVELRMKQGTPQQRWHLHDMDVTSEWLPLK